MRAVVQRVTRAKVSIDGENIAQTGQGIVILLGVASGDKSEDAAWLAKKIAELRIFDDEQGKLNLSLLDIKGEALIVSQFTLLGDCRKGRRPGYSQAAAPDEAKRLYLEFIELFKESGLKTGHGQFQANMLVEIYNDGPVTLILDSKQ